MQVYELGYLVLSSIAPEAVGDVVAKIKALIAEAGGTEIASEDPEKIDLAYTMTKVVGASRYVVNDAYIGWVKFEAEPAAAPALNEKVSKMDEVVRCLLIKTTREADFTFAKAREALVEKEEAMAAAKAEAETPKEVVVE